jgi:hypothetical protein
VIYGIRSTTDTPLDPDSTRKLCFLTGPPRWHCESTGGNGTAYICTR